VDVYLKALCPTQPYTIRGVRQYKARKTETGTYDVELNSREVSAVFREAFGRLLRGKKAGRNQMPMPPALTNVSVTISHTFATCIRVRILKEMARVHNDANPELSAFVTNYEPRPVLKIRKESGRVDIFPFVDAVRRFGSYLTHEFLVEEASYAKGNVRVENLTPYFLVLSPDHVLPGIAPSPDTQGQGQKRGLDETDTPNPKKATAGRGAHTGGSRGSRGSRGAPRGGRGGGGRGHSSQQPAQHPKSASRGQPAKASKGPVKFKAPVPPTNPFAVLATIESTGDNDDSIQTMESDDPESITLDKSYEAIREQNVNSDDIAE